MSKVDWSQLSGPHVSRRTLVQLAAATGAAGFAQRMETRYASAVRASAARAPLRQEPKTGGTLRVAFVLSQIVTLDPQIVSQGAVAGSILPSIFSSLVQFDEPWDSSRTWPRRGRSRKMARSTSSICGQD